MLDSAKCHLTDYVKSTIHDKMAIIPGGLTKKLQALDISVNKSFKSKLRAKWEEWMINTAKHTYTRSGKMRHAPLQEVCNWIVESWKDVTPECILNGFRRALNESFDDEESEEETSDLEEDSANLDSLPTELYENFNFISDDEFEGFDV